MTYPHPLVQTKIAPLRGDPMQPDDFDQVRAKLVLDRWNSQTEPLRRRDREVEGSLRMLAGQQWNIWNQWLQRYIDITEWMTDEERRWRQRPVLNRLLYWFMITQSRFTENPPIITFQPGNADRASAMLAEAMDTIWKGEWRNVGMADVLDRMFSWLIPSGRAFTQSVLDLTKGDFKPWVAEGMLPVVDELGGMMGEQYHPQVPYQESGEPAAYLSAETGELMPTAQPHAEREGAIRVDVLSCLQVRGQWGPAPWHEKSWHQVRAFLTPEEIYDLFEVQLPPDRQSATRHEGSHPGFLERMFFGTGFYGAAGAKPGAEFAQQSTIEEYVEVLTQWEKPCRYEGMEETPESPGGRLTIVAAETKRVLVDSPRPFRFPWTSGIRCFDFVNIPGRPSGTSPQEMLNPIQRSYNRFTAQIMENANLIANPIGILDQGSGLTNVQMTNKPGARYVANRRPGVAAFEYVQPPSMSRDVYQAHALLRTEMQDLGSLEGAEGRPPTPDPSGRLVENLRFNSDRWLGAPSRRFVDEISRMALDWKAILEVAWPEQKIIAYMGADSIAHTVAVLPEMFKVGRIVAIPDVESMLPESRSERQNKMFTLWQASAWGPPDSPQATQKFLELARFPHISRMAWPGGVDVVMAKQENGRFIMGETWESVPIYEWQDDTMHLYVHEEFMKSPEFQKVDPAVQEQLVMHRALHLQAAEAKLIQQAMQQQAMLELAPDAAGAANGNGNGGSPSGNGGGGGGGGGKKSGDDRSPEPRQNPQGNRIHSLQGG